MAAKRKRRKGDVERQIAALPLRLGPGERIEVLLITSRETRRWVIPKGNLMKGLKRFEAAAAEAREEAGLEGRILRKPVGRFLYWKRRASDFLLCQVDVFLLAVTGQAESWKERDQRRQLWVTPSRAAELVLEPGLQSILLALEDDEAVRERLKAVAAKADRDKRKAAAKGGDPAP